MCIFLNKNMHLSLASISLGINNLLRIHGANCMYGCVKNVRKLGIETPPKNLSALPLVDYQNPCYNQSHITNGQLKLMRSRPLKIGYVRVSKHEQNEALQLDALKAAGCEKIFIDKASGAKEDRKELNEALVYIRPGDAFMVWKLDRAGRSLKHLIEILAKVELAGVDFISLTENIDTTTPGGRLIFHLMGALAEFERALIRERTNAGLAAARARGHNGGRPRIIANGKVKQIQKLMEDTSMTIGDIMEATGVSKSTLYRYRRANGMTKKASEQ